MSIQLKNQMALLTNLMAINGKMTLKELSVASGIDTTRCFRLKNGIGELVLSEIVALEAVFKVDIYSYLAKYSEVA